jgi:high-affinity iron transporter
MAPTLQAFIITLREGLEAFLIVAISLAYLRKSGREPLVRAVYAGIIGGLAVSAVGGYLLYNASNQEFLEGPLALVAAVSVAFLVAHMWRAGRTMKRSIEGRLGQSAARAGIGALAGVFTFTVLMIGREGMETALLLMQLKSTLNLAIGAALGIAGSAALAWLWSRYGHRINMGLFFQVTAIFLFVFVVQLVIRGIHEMSEQDYLPFSTTIHDATEEWGPDGRFGQLLTYLLVIAPAAWLGISGIRMMVGRPPAPPRSAAASASTAHATASTRHLAAHQ